MMLKRCLVACFAVAMIAQLSFAQVNITDGSSTYEWDPGSPQSTNFIDPTAGDVSFEDMWIVRFTDSSALGGVEQIYELDDRNDSLGVDFQGTNNSGDTAVSSWNINGIGGASDPLFTIDLTHTVSTSPTGEALLEHQMELSNFIGDSNLVAGSDLDLFYFNDFDIPTFSDNTAKHNLDGTNRVISMFSADGHSAATTGTDATFFQLRAVGDGTRLSTAVLNGEIVDLNNSGSPLENTDINGMFQWDTAVPDDSGGLNFGVSSAVPEPSSVAFIALIGLAAIRPRRRR